MEVLVYPGLMQRQSSGCANIRPRQVQTETQDHHREILMNRYVFAFAAAALSSAAVMATPALHAEDMKLSWGDLDLATPAGQTELSHRIDRIARTLCDEQVQTGSLIDNSRKCQADVHAKLAAQVAQTNQKVAVRN
jgi:UrcA family protein